MPMANGGVKAGTWPDYVARETRRSPGERGREDADLSRGSASMCPALPDDTETVYEVVKAAYAAGAHGVVASREYEEYDGADPHGIRTRGARGREDRVTQGRSAKFNGIQMGPHTILDEGIERTLDLIQSGGRHQCGDAVQPRLQRRADQGPARSRRPRRAARPTTLAGTSAGVAEDARPGTTRTRRFVIRWSTTRSNTTRAICSLNSSSPRAGAA